MKRRICSGSTNPIFHQRPLVTALCIATSLTISTPILAQQTQGTSTSETASASIHEFNIPPQPLSEAIIVFGQQSGLQISASSTLVENKQAPGVKGTMTTEQALSQLLAGTGLTYRSNGTMVSLEASSGATTLPPVKVTAEERLSSDPPPAYAGEQVASGSHVGLLGNKNLFDTPYSTASYTAELIENQHLKTLAEFARNDASVQATGGTGGSGESLVIRGFNSGGNDGALYDGLPGLAHRRLSSVETMERIEVLKGAHALLTGKVGAVGGVANLVPKRPLDTPLTKLTTGYETDSLYDLRTDISRRFGAQQQFGARINGIYRDGERALENNNLTSKDIALALDYAGEKLRAEFFFDHSDRNETSISDFFLLSSDAPIPNAPDVGSAITQPWTSVKHDFTRNLLRLEYDLTSNWTLHAAYGTKTYEGDWLRTLGLDTDEDGNFSQIALLQADEADAHAGNAGIRGHFDTGTISHELSLEYLASKSKGYRLGGSTAGFSVDSNLYNPVFVPRPDFDPLSGDIPKDFEVASPSIAVADTLGLFEERVLLTLGLRRQKIESIFYDIDTGVRTSSFNESATTPSIGVLYKLRPTLSLYGNYIESLEEGPTAPDIAVNAGEVFSPSETQQIELGGKWDLGELGLTAALFQIEQPNGILDESLRFDVDGEQRHQGMELNAFGNLRPNLRLLAGLTYLDAELTKTQDRTLDGNSPTGVPEWAAVMSVEWDITQLPGLTLTGRANYTGSQFAAGDNSKKAPSYKLYDIGARYQRTIGGRGFTFRADIHNLLDENYWGAGNGTVTTGDPRSIILSMSMEL